MKIVNIWGVWNNPVHLIPTAAAGVRKVQKKVVKTNSPRAIKYNCIKFMKNLYFR